jgi:aromatic ring-opening dioxygenase catalytic subunit (LigB family)
MNHEHDEETTGRRGFAAGVAGAAITAALAGAHSAHDVHEPEGSRDRRAPAKTPGRMPVVFVPHGGGPWPFVEIGFGDRAELDELASYLRSIRAIPKQETRALLVISAHWEEPVPTVMTSDHPPMLYDYYGFPPASYQITWPAPGSPELAVRVRSLLGAAGFKAAANAERGFDHGTFVPLKLAYPDAEVPTVQLSLKRGLAPEEHLAMGRALAPLRDEGVFIIGSGMTYHNLRAFDPHAGPISEAFDAWLREAATLDPTSRDARLAAWSHAPSARLAHPREEHLLPLMVIAGAAGQDRGTTAYNGTIRSLRLSAYHYG